MESLAADLDERASELDSEESNLSFYERHLQSKRRDFDRDDVPFKADQVDWNRRTVLFNGERNRHDVNRPDPRNKGAVARWQAEANRLNGIRNALQAEEKRLKQRAQELDERQAKLDAEAADLQRRRDALNKGQWSLDSETERFRSRCEAAAGRARALAQAKRPAAAPAALAEIHRYKRVLESYGEPFDGQREIAGRIRRLEQAIEEGARGAALEDLNSLRGDLKQAINRLPGMKVASIEGEWHRLGTNGPVPMKVGDVVVEGEYRTGPDARMGVTLPDGTVFMLWGNTTLSFPETFVSRPDEPATFVTRIKEGVVRWIGRRTNRVAATARIITPTCITAVRGTDLLVEVGPSGQTWVRVVEGVVECTPTGETEAVPVRAGEELSVSADAKTVRKGPSNAAEIERRWPVDDRSPATPWRTIAILGIAGAVFVGLVWAGGAALKRWTEYDLLARSAGNWLCAFFVLLLGFLTLAVWFAPDAVLDLREYVFGPRTARYPLSNRLNFALVAAVAGCLGSVVAFLGCVFTHRVWKAWERAR